nr:MAG TPA: hypothetical protein [Bacteriophage sp.]
MSSKILINKLFLHGINTIINICSYSAPIG